jgi:hypothetical protein
VTFYDRKPILDVQCDERIVHALMYGAGAAKLQQMLKQIRFSDGTTVNFNEIWTINPMPKVRIPQAELDAVNLAEAEEPWVHFAGSNTQDLSLFIPRRRRSPPKALHRVLTGPPGSRAIARCAMRVVRKVQKCRSAEAANIGVAL